MEARELKFKFWDTVDQCMIDWLTAIQSAFNNTRGGNLLYDLIIDPRYLKRQFTGMKDNEGVEIYEGDIMQCQDSECYSHLFKVEYNNEVCAFVLIEQAGGWDSIELAEYGIIIGNVYENPTLLNANL